MKSAQSFIQKKSGIFYSSLLFIMLIGLLYSRAVLSLSQIVWLVTAIFSFNKENSKENKPIVIWSSVIIILFFLGAWQQFLITETYDYLLGIIVYPIAILSITTLNESVKNKLKLVWVTVATLSCLIPIYYFLFHQQQTLLVYGLGQVVFTPMDTDHVRYSIFLASALTLLFTITTLNFRVKMAIGTFLFLMLIVLAVRTGWAALAIISMSMLFIWYIKTPIKLFVLVLAFITLSVAAFFIFPQVKQKIDYTVYDWQLNKGTNYNAEYSDAARFSINQIAFQIIQQNKNINVGWAKIPLALESEFQIKYPSKKLIFHWPFNQFLFWYLGSGWWGCLL